MLCVALAGCGFLKPDKVTARHFVLMPLPTTGSGTTTGGAMPVGLGQVKLPAYLFNSSLALRRSPHEIEYLPFALWAERLDTGFQRVLAANLATLLPTDRVLLSDWRKEDVAAEVRVTLEQFDVDAAGQGVLIARWRILSPGGEKVLKTGESRLKRQGPPPGPDPSGSVATLSELAGECSREISQALRNSAPVVR